MKQQGEGRSVKQIDTRVSQAARLGCTRIIVPMGQLKGARAALASLQKTAARARSGSSGAGTAEAAPQESVSARTARGAHALATCDRPTPRRKS